MEHPPRDLELALMRLAWRADSIDKWRDDVEKRLTACIAQVDGLTKSDEIAEAVAAKMRTERTLHLTALQKVVGLVIGAVAFADGIRGLVGA